MYRLKHLIGLMLPAFFVLALVAAGIYVAARVHETTEPPKPQTTGIKRNADNVPTPGTPLKFGLYISDSDTPKKAEAKLGASVNIMGWFQNWGDDLYSNKLAYACKNGYVPLIAWESWNGRDDKNSNPYPLKDIAAGKFDNLIKKQLQEITDTCSFQTVLIRFDHEMDIQVGEDAWYPWQGDPATYVAAWRHVVDMSHAMNPHIKWILSANRGIDLTRDYYPGDSYVDYAGITLNHAYFKNNPWANFQAFYTANQRVIEGFGKPVIVAETATAEGSDGQKAQWISNMFTYARSNPAITALVWFDHQQTYSDGLHSDYRIDSSPSALQAFTAALAPPAEAQHE